MMNSFETLIANDARRLVETRIHTGLEGLRDLIWAYSQSRKDYADPEGVTVLVKYQGMDIPIKLESVRDAIKSQFAPSMIEAKTAELTCEFYQKVKNLEV